MHRQGQKREQKHTKDNFVEFQNHSRPSINFDFRRHDTLPMRIQIKSNEKEERADLIRVHSTADSGCNQNWYHLKFLRSLKQGVIF